MQERIRIIALSPTQNWFLEMQLEAARIVIVLASYASLLSVYKVTGWDEFSVSREKKKTFIILQYSQWPITWFITYYSGLNH